MNANQVFLWRRQHANGMLSGRKRPESKRKALKLLPVQISAEPVPSTEVHAAGHVEIVFGDGLRVRCVGQFNADVFGNIRRWQGLVRRCTKEINQAGYEVASVRIAAAIATMRRYQEIRVPYFDALLNQARKRALQPDTGRQIVHRPGNPMLRYVGGAALNAAETPPSTSAQESLDL